MTYRSAALVSVGVLTLLLAAPAISRADTVLFTNLGAGSSYNTTVGNVAGNFFDGNVYAEGDTFNSATSTKLSSIDIALSCDFVGGCPEFFTVSLTRNSGDQPSTVLESFTIAGTSLGLFGVNNPVLVLNSILKPSLTAGSQYWVTVVTDPNNSIIWNLNSTGDTKDEAISTDEAATWFSPSGLTPGAFQVNGATAVGTTPEPSSFGLMFTGLLSLVGGRRFGVRGCRGSSSD